MLLAIILGSTACEKRDSNTKQVDSQSGQRFLPVQGTGFDAGLALDTKTGQLCKTVEWQAGLGMPNIASNAPTCKSLYDRDANSLVSR